MTWDSFTLIAGITSVLWIAGALLSVFSSKRGPAIVLSLAGSLLFLAFVIGLWISLERPPMRTMGETRLWYSLFLSFIGIFIYARWHYKWILPFSALMSIIYAGVNVLKPQLHERALMPALQSVWFVPHVTVYMFAYAVLGAVTVFAVYLWIRSARKPVVREEMDRCDALVRIGWGFLTLGIVMGALWAKQAWGDYWAWDPKETWAAVTWVAYLLYLHLGNRIRNPRRAFALLVFCFILLQMCWWGVNYLPSATGGMHTY